MTVSNPRPVVVPPAETSAQPVKRARGAAWPCSSARPRMRPVRHSPLFFEPGGRIRATAIPTSSTSR